MAVPMYTARPEPVTHYDGTAPRHGTRCKPREEWLALIPEAHECYVTWEQTAVAKRRVLMIDDEPDVGAFVCGVAESLSYETCFTDRASRFGRLYRSFRPNLVILDLATPGSDGIELLQLLAEENSRASILLMSGVDPGMREAALHLGEARGLHAGRCAETRPRCRVAAASCDLQQCRESVSGTRGDHPAHRGRRRRIIPRTMLPTSSRRLQ